MPPFVEARMLCASPMMTSGWVVKTLDEQVLHVREAILPTPLGDRVQMQLEEIENPGKPPYRLRGKTTNARRTTSCSHSIARCSS